MLKMIIVDDEKIIRETIHSLIDWNSLGIDVAAVCKDGIEAFDCILDGSPAYSGAPWPCRRPLSAGIWRTLPPPGSPAGGRE